MRCCLDDKPVTVRINCEHFDLIADLLPPCPDVNCDCGVDTQLAFEIRCKYTDLNKDQSMPHRYLSRLEHVPTPNDEGLTFTDIHDLVDQCEEYTHANPERFPGMFPADYSGWD